MASATLPVNSSYRTFNCSSWDFGAAFGQCPKRWSQAKQLKPVQGALWTLNLRSWRLDGTRAPDVKRRLPTIIVILIPISLQFGLI
mmetsp:Transcript_83437/g.174602  ORF Transcript_83437/g.174602 Transcript_83437/m.174602 type:complete len:86 (-) Transcript_83437:414-671(-)